MPIIFENRLGNSESDKKLRRIYRLHHILWTLYYALGFAGFGFGMAVFVGIKGNPLFGILIAVLTIGVLVLFLKRSFQSS